MTYRSGRHFLQIPGPTNVPDRVLRAIDMPTMDHRGQAFAELGHEVLDGLKHVFQTRQPVIIYPASGTGAWEAALVNTLYGDEQPPPIVLTAEGVGGTIRYSALGLPGGITYDSGSGVLSGTPTQQGEFPVTFTACWPPSAVRRSSWARWCATT